MAVQKNFVIKNGLEVNGTLVSADALVDKVGIGTDSFDSLSKLTVDGSITAKGNLYLQSGSGIGSIYNAKGTILEYENAYINTGIVTNISGTAVTYTTGNINNLSGSGDIDYSTGTITTLDGSSATFGTVDAVSNLYVGGALFDNNDLDGDPDQVLTSTGTGVTWKAIPSSPWSLNGSDLYYSSGNVGVGTNTPNGAADPSNTTIFNAGIVTANYYYGDGSGLTNLNISAIETDPIVGAVNGIVKADGAGNISAAISGTDYLTPTGDGSGLSGIVITETDPIVGAINGIVKADGIGNISTAISGTDYLTPTGDASGLTNLPQSGIGIGTIGGIVGYAATFINFYGSGVSTSYYSESTGIATIYFEGGSTTNIFGPGSTSSPSWYINGDNTTGVYSPSFGNLTFLSNGTEILNTNPSGIEVVTGISTFNAVEINDQTRIPLTITSNVTYNAIAISQSGGGTNIKLGGSTYSAEFGSNFVINESNGNVGINSTSPTEKLDVNGVVKAVDFNSTSDIKLKENITTVDNALELTNQLRGVRFEWKKDGKPSYGVIAQELEAILPELVSQGDPKTVNYNGIIGVLIEAVKELSAEVEQLKNK